MTFIPVFVSAGRIPSPSPLTGPCMPNIFGTEGPVISASSIATFCSLRLIATASIAETIDFPTPPFPLTTPMTFFMLLFELHGSMRLSFFDAQDAPQVEQSCVHSSFAIISSMITITVVYGLLYPNPRQKSRADGKRPRFILQLRRKYDIIQSELPVFSRK